jgi:hypothetical protein
MGPMIGAARVHAASCSAKMNTMMGFKYELTIYNSAGSFCTSISAFSVIIILSVLLLTSPSEICDFSQDQHIQYVI